MVFLELNSYIEPPPGYPGRPYFDSDLSPLIVKRSDDVKMVLWFHHDAPPTPTDLRDSRLTELGPMTTLSAEVLAMLKA